MLFGCRLKIIAILTNFFRSVIALSSDELVKCVYLCLNKVSPASLSNILPLFLELNHPLTISLPSNIINIYTS